MIRKYTQNARGLKRSYDEKANIEEAAERAARILKKEASALDPSCPGQAAKRRSIERVMIEPEKGEVALNHRGKIPETPAARALRESLKKKREAT